MEGCSTSLITKEMQIKSAWVFTSDLSRWPLSKEQKIPSVGEDAETLEPLFYIPHPPIGGDIKCCSHCEKQCGSFSKKVKIGLPYNPAISLLGIYPKEFKAGSQRENLHRHVHYNVHNSQEIETAQMYIE